MYVPTSDIFISTVSFYVWPFVTYAQNTFSLLYVTAFVHPPKPVMHIVYSPISAKFTNASLFSFNLRFLCLI